MVRSAVLVLGLVVGGMAIDHTHVAEVARLDVGEAAPPAAKMAVSTRAVKQDIGEEVKQQEQWAGAPPSGPQEAVARGTARVSSGA